MRKCRICNSNNVEKLIDLGESPLAGDFGKKLNEKNKLYPLKLSFCTECYSAQVNDIVPPEELFGKYHYSSSQVEDLKKYFKDYSDKILKKIKKNEEFKLLDVGSNDGVLINNFIGLNNIIAIGVDPSFDSKINKNVIQIKEYFNRKIIKKIELKYGKFDLINASNVFAHIPDLNEIFESMKSLLKDDGEINIEVHSLIELLKFKQYDTIYHEHIYYHSLNSLNSFALRHDIKLIKFEKIGNHGGSIKATYSNRNLTINENRNLKSELKKEKLEILKLKNKFKIEFKEHKAQMKLIINLLKNSNMKIAAYGASGRAVMFLNQIFDIKEKLLKVVIDDSQVRIGKKLPYLKTDIVSRDWLKINKVDVIIISAWNYSESILEKLNIMNYKGIVIIPFPYPRFIYY